MSSNYRLDYASASPRAVCSICGQVIRSGEIRFHFYNSFRHLDCVTAIEVVKVWQHCRSLEGVPGFSSLEYEDRQQVQALFKALLASTPMQQSSIIRHKIAAAASVASDYQGQWGSHRPNHSSANQPMERTLSNEMMMDSSASPPSMQTSASVPRNLSVFTLHPSAMQQMAHASQSQSQPQLSGMADSSQLPPAAPTLTSTPSALASYLSNLSCNTPTNNPNAISPVPQLFAFNGSSAVIDPHSAFVSSSHVASHSNGITSSHSSPAGLPRSLRDNASVTPVASSVHIRAISPLDSNSNLHFNSLQPPSPHSNHTSPVPFSSNPLFSMNRVSLQSSSVPFAPSSVNPPHILDSSSQHRSTRTKRKFGAPDSIPEEDATSSYSPMLSPVSANRAAMDEGDIMMDASSGISSGSTSLNENSSYASNQMPFGHDDLHSAKKRRTVAIRAIR